MPVIRNRQDIIQIIENARKINQKPNLSQTDLAYGLDLSELDLSGVDLSFTDLRGANLCRADLRGAYLVGTDLRGTQLKEANLRKTRLTGANLTGLDFREVEITKKQIMGAGNIEGVILPDGSPAISPLDLFEF